MFKIRFISGEKWWRATFVMISIIYVVFLASTSWNFSPPGGRVFFSTRGFQEYIYPQEPTYTFREGPDRSGSQAVDRSLRKAKLAWQTRSIFADIHSASKSTPAVDASGIYLGTDLGIFYRFDHDGKILWSFKTDGGSQGIHGTALLDDQHVYFGNYAGKFYCLDKKNGQLIWVTRLADAVGSSPLIQGNTILISAEFSRPRNGYLVALEKSTGNVLWVSSDFGEQVHSSPTLSLSTGVVGVGSNANIFFGIDSFSGETLWEFVTDGPIKGTAGIYHDKFYFSSWDNFFYAVDLNGNLLGKVNLGKASQSSVAIDLDFGFGYISSAAGNIYKINLDSMTISTQRALIEPNSINKLSMPSPVLLSYKKKIWVFSSCFGDSVCRLDGNNLAIQERIPVGGIVTGSFAFWNSSLYFNVNDRGLVRLDL